MRELSTKRPADQNENHTPTIDDPSLRSEDLAGRVLEKFGRKVHPRSVERALARYKKTPVTDSAARHDVGGRWTTAYEQLRSDVLEGATARGHFGLVILLREGVAAWMAHSVAEPMTVPRVTVVDRPKMASIVSDDIRDDMVTALANMVMAPEVDRV